jgi:hypothetical protein
MKLLLYPDGNDLSKIDELTDDDLVYLFNVCLNYGSYIEELLKKPNHVMMMQAPGKSADIVRANLEGQLQLCKSFVEIWKANINPKDNLKKKN